MMELTETDLRVLELLRSRKDWNGLTCTEVGEALWHSGPRGGRRRQSYARPAGRVLKRLVRAGLLVESDRKTEFRNRCYYRRVFLAKG